MYLQGVENVYDLTWTTWQEQGLMRRISYGDVYHQNEVEQSRYNFEASNQAVLLNRFGEHEADAARLLREGLALPAYEQILKAAHSFNLLDARGAISVTERAQYIARIRNLSRQVAQAYVASREQLGFPMSHPTHEKAA